MTLGETIIAAIARGRLLGVADNTSELKVVLVWSSGAAEQIEAVVAEHVEACLQELRNDLRLSQGAYAMCDANLKQALVDLKFALDREEVHKEFITSLRKTIDDMARIAGVPR